MYIETVPNRNSPPAILLREGWREGNKTRKRTLANISDWPPEKIETFRRLLRDEPLVSPQDLLATQKTLPHGHVEALLLAIRKLGLDSLISAKSAAATSPKTSSVLPSVKWSTLPFRSARR